MRIAQICTALFIATTTLGCFIVGSMEDFKRNGIEKAAFDMNCEKDKLNVTDLGNGSMGVRGCDKQARYQYVDGAGWVLNSGESTK